MFIAHYPDGKTLREGDVYWDDLPHGISSLQIQTFSNEIITLPKCDSYFFSNEAVSRMGIGDFVADDIPILTAKIIGGIIGDKAIKLRIDTRGHITIYYLNKDELTFAEWVYRKGI